MAARLIEPLTSRLRLRQWTDRDPGPFAALNADPLVMRHFPALLSREQSDALMESFTERLRADGYGLWSLEVRTTGEFIGFVGLAARACPKWSPSRRRAPCGQDR
jgi:RimJ/RimL family protein N-acetyltransferase